MEISILGCGWLGFPLAKYLVHKGYKVKGSTTSLHKIQELSSFGITPFLIKLEEHDQNYRGFLNSEYLVLNVPSKNISLFNGLIENIEKLNVKKVIFVSSTSVYKNNNSIVTEDSEIELLNPLVEIENLFRNNKFFETTILRFAGLFGENRNPSNFFSSNQPIGNSQAPVNMIHQSDCIRIIEQILVQDIWNETLNCCADTHPTKEDFYGKAFDISGLKRPAFIKTQTEDYKIISSEKLKMLLKYEFEFPDLVKSLMA